MGAKPVWRCKCGYHLPRHPNRLSDGPKCPYCSSASVHEDSRAKPVHMTASYRVAPNETEIQK